MILLIAFATEGVRAITRSLKDILFILMKFELSFSNLYKTVSKTEGLYSARLKTIAAVLAKEEAAHYEWLKSLLEDDSLKSILLDEAVYEAAEKNLEAFGKSIAWTGMSSDAELLQFAYDYELKNAQTLWNIYSVAKEYEKDEEAALIKFLVELIKTEESHAANLKQFLKGRK
jgi:rubrerythrin